jgi:prolyl-tRNA synthetase
VWPREVSPFDLHVVAATKEDAVYAAADALVAEFESDGLDVLYDDRPKVSPGVKFGDAELIGVPLIVIVGKGVADGNVELWDRRTGERTTVPLAEIRQRVAAELG